MQEEKQTEYLDETILELRRLKQKENSDEIYIKGELLEFETVKLIEDKFEVQLPTKFVTMPEKIANIKYPTNNRPQIILTDLLGRTNLAFNLLEQPAQTSELGQVIKTFSDVIKKTNPATILLGKGEEELENNKVAWFDFKGYGIDGQVYNLFFVTVIEGKLLHGIFNCSMEDMEEHKDIAFKTMKSIKDLNGGNEHA